MNNHFSKEELYHSLPDYISGNSTDAELTEKISTEIEINPEFRSEFEEMKRTISFLNSAEIESPQDSYFNNLPVKINERITRETIQQSFWNKPGLIWKILFPILSIFIIAFLIYDSSIKNTEVASETENDKTKTTLESVKSPEESGLPSMIGNEMKRNQDMQNNVLKKKKGANVKTDIGNSNQVNDKNVVVQQPLISEIVKHQEAYGADFKKEITSYKSEITDFAILDSDEDIMLIDDEIENLEDELMEFTPEEQEEIIENLIKSQI